MFKKALSLILTLLLVFSCCSAFAAGIEATVVLPETYRAITMRSATTTSSAATGYVHDGDDITVLKKGKTWSRIRKESSGRVGYIKNIYISDQTRPSKSYDWGHVSYDYVNAKLRKSRSANSKLLETLRRGAKLQLKSKSNGWYKVVTTTGKTGYIKASFIKTGASKTARTDLTLRATPNGEEITTIYGGESVKALTVYGDWTLVEYEEEQGYVFTICLR